MLRPKKIKENSIVQALVLTENYAKTQDGISGKELGQTVLTHCEIVGMTARALIQLEPKTAQPLFPDGSALIAACHDVGKISPTFQAKLRHAVGEDSLSILQGADWSLEHDWGGHAGVSLLAAREWTADCWIPEILGSHHGSNTKTKVNLFRIHDSRFGGEPWQEIRTELFKSLKSFFNEDFPVVKSALQARVLLGLTTVADWIGSSDAFQTKRFPTEADVKEVLQQSGFGHPEIRKGLSFQDVFGFSPRGIQKDFADSVHGPGAYVLEAPMGVGKTEAALYAAYRMLCNGSAAGIYFALPTQATSNQIWKRMNEFLETILVQDAKTAHAVLVHSASALVQSQWGEEAAPGGSWFSSAKRSMLASFGVGTIDQALMSVMAVRHGAVRAFGLAGKVVILDEVHSYDIYTGTILDALVKALVELGCIVMILSATLTTDRRKSLLGMEAKCDDYPLMTALEEGTLTEKAVNLEGTDKVVALSFGALDGADVEKTVVAKACDGQQILWIENTVKSAQNRYERLVRLCRDKKVRVGLLHSRFTTHDRTCLEKEWVGLFGKASDERQLTGRILVGTQVLEQSLDIDADFLVTAICPTDFLLQRMGRLWRHAQTKRPASAKCEACILSPAVNRSVGSQEEFGDSRWVYAPYVLWRTHEVFRDLKTVRLPADIRPLVERTYAQREENEFAVVLKTQLEEGDSRRLGTKALRRLASLALAEDLPEFDDERAQTRYSSRTEVLLLLLKDLQRLPDCTKVVLPDGDELILRPQDDSGERKRIAVRLMANCVKVPTRQAPDVQDVSWLDRYLYVSPFETTRIRVGILSDDSRIESKPTTYKACYNDAGFQFLGK